MNARMRLDSAVSQAYGVACTSSNTLQSRDREAAEAARASFIEAIVQAIGAGTDPRLAWTLAPL